MTDTATNRAEPITEHEFCVRFVTHMVKRAPFEKFEDGTSVDEYARRTAPLYWGEPDYRDAGPEESAEADMSYWGED
jgi:hypothetical protein